MTELNENDGRTAFARRIRALISEHGSAGAVARLTGVSESVVRKWRDGLSDPSREHIVALARAANVAIAWLAAGDGPRMDAQGSNTAPGDSHPIPLYAPELGAGQMTWPEGAEPLTHIALSLNWLTLLDVTPQQCALLRIDGDSMTPTLFAGDVVLVDRQRRQLTADDLYVIRVDDYLSAKRLRRHPGGALEIISDNPRYSPIVVDANHREDVVILGKVIYRAGRL